ncbi:MAG: protein kinase [Phycisphaerae bacterium]|jgi:serine/threonine protein kinase/Tol biopolymer transport system component
MTLTEGTKLGPYEILAPLGAGGMGEVYRARDAKLDRDVAIKVLPATMTRDPERVARFEREAKLLASLNHPNIAAIYGFDEAAGKKFLALEFVEGDTLAKRLEGGPLPIDEALEVGKHVADALEAAHSKGIVHRDLKPANVMVTPDGTVKVLDFGLGRAVADEPGSSSLAYDSPTITADYTRPGVVIGTAAYMSPEQARGRPVDQRTDIWSLGVILFECLTGDKLFGGETTTDSLGAVLHKDLDFDALPEQTPKVVRHVLRRCLQRDKRDRLQAAGDARLELEDAARDYESGFFEPSDLRRTTPGGGIWKLATALLAVLLAITLVWANRGRPPVKPAGPVNAPVVVGVHKLTDLPGLQSDSCLSPDGKSLLYVAREGEDFDIFLQRVGGQKPINLTADCPHDDFNPAFSPGGERIAFRSQREGGGLFIMGATGESPRRVSEEGFDPAWSPTGTELIYTTEDVEGPYSRSSVAQLWALDLQTRGKRRLTEQDAVAPRYSPSGKFVAFWAAIAGIRDIFIIPIEGGKARPITQDIATDWNPFFSPDGRTLFFISDRSGSPDLWRVPIDPVTGRTTGAMHPVTAGVTALDEATIAADGTHIAFTAPLLMSQIERYPFDPETERVTGERETIYASTSVLRQFDVADDGRRIAFRTGAPKEDIIVMNADGTGRRRLMDDAHRDRGPRWTPDGEWLIFYSNRGGFYDAWRIRPDGTDMSRLTGTDGRDVTNAVLAPDGRLMAAGVSTDSGESMALFELDRPLSSIDVPLPVPESTLTGFVPLRFSPDGLRLAGTSNFIVVIYDVQSGDLSPLYGPGMGEVQNSQASSFDWIDNTRLIVWDEKHASAFICSVDSGTARPLPELQGPCGIRVVDEGRSLVVNRLRAESDIWMLTLGHVTEQPGTRKSDNSSSATSSTGLPTTTGGDD